MKKVYACAVLTTALILSVKTQAATITASNCSFSAVSAAISNASNGDTVLIPAGNCTWNTQLNISVGITLQGAGMGVTILNDNVPKAGQTNRMIQVTVNAPYSVRLTNFTLSGMAPNSFTNDGHINFYGTSKAIRVDHIEFKNLTTSAVHINGDHWGVIDHNVLLNKTFSNAFIIKHANWGGSNYGDGSWAEDLSLGTGKAIYIEDNTISSDSAPPGSVDDCFDGGRFVFRNNTVTNDYVQGHGTDTGQRHRGCRSMEVYNNTFNMTLAVDTAHYWKSGGGVVFNNTVNGSGMYNTFVKLVTDRATHLTAVPWGRCDGSSPYDQNTPGQAGYRCADQVGAGTSRNLGGLDTPTAQWVGNTLDPLYVWNNDLNGRIGIADIASDSDRVQVGRDVLTQPRPGYTPYIYPHPLVSGAPAPTTPIPVPTAPGNVRIIR